MDNKKLEKLTREIFPEKKDYEIPALLGFARIIENETRKELYNKYISKWNKELNNLSDRNKYKQYSQTFINEFERDLKIMETVK